MERHTRCLDRPLRVLAVAPDPYLEERASDLPWDYLSIDLSPGKAMRQMDLTALSLPDWDRELVIAYHVLEHIPDDRAALAEIRRILRPDGMALIEVPLNGDETDERYMYASADLRARFYGQPDHVRLYGEHDFRRRLADVGLRATPIRVAEVFRADLEKAALLPTEVFFVAMAEPGVPHEPAYDSLPLGRSSTAPTPE